MNRGLLRIAIAIVTFVAGFGLATLRSSHRVSPSRNQDSSQVAFEADGITSAFQSHYHSSDGQMLRYGCYEHNSSVEAQRDLDQEVDMKYRYSPDGHLTKVGVVERTVTFDGRGNTTGVRVVLDAGLILWTDGARSYRISAPSVQYALLFEHSRSWSWEGCMKLPPRNERF